MDPFQQAAARVRTEQFLLEKAASAQPAAMEVVQQAQLEQVEDLGLFKLASTYCPTDPVGMYVKLGGKTKVAEPPPPKGVSTKAWDKLLQKGPPAGLK